MKDVLVVDDEPHIRRLTRNCLQRADFRVEVADNGIDALAKLDAQSFDAVVTDVSMPRMDGRQLCEAICMRDLGCEPKLFVVTAHPEEDSREWARALPNLEFLEKPVSPRRLIALLRERLGVE